MTDLWGVEFRRKVLALAVRGDLLRSCQGAFTLNMFGETDTPHRQLAAILLKFSKEHQSERPGNGTMDELVKQAGQFQPPASRVALYSEWAEVRSIEVGDPSFVRKAVGRVARENALADAISAASRLLERSRTDGGEVDARFIANQVLKASQIGTLEGEGRGWMTGDLSYWDQASRRRIPTRLGPTDRYLGGGIQYGELHFVLAPPKGFKTLTLGNFAVGALQSGLGVALFSYEMRKEAMLQRLDRRLTRKTRQELLDDLTEVRRAHEDTAAWGWGHLHVEEFQPKRHGVDAAARVVDRLRGDGKEIDLVVLDYLNIMSGGADKEKRHELASIAREMSAFGKEYDVGVWSAALANRKAINKARVYKDDIAESFETISVADGILAVCSTEAMRKLNLRNLFVATARNEGEEVMIGTFVCDPARMLMEFDPAATEAMKRQPDTDEDAGD